MFIAGDRLLRQVNPVYRPHYDRLMSSGLYESLTKDGLLISHTEVDPRKVKAKGAYKVIEPERVPVITYPYEWSFSQLKDAALATLEAHRRALAYGMVIKDASAYNIQFVAGKPSLIDTLSFEINPEGRPWIAYRQFCQHFLAPLALMAHVDVRLGLLMRDFIDGIPLDLAAHLLPRRTLINFNLLAHIHMHAAAGKQVRSSASVEAERGQRVSASGLHALTESLISAIRGLKWQLDRTRWSDYYHGDSYSETGLARKQALVREFLQETGAKRVLDLGANTGLYSRIGSSLGMLVISSDSDPGAVELSYQEVVSQNLDKVLPVLVDLTNPSPALGWANRERDSFEERFSADCALALALIHHLAISNNVPLSDIASTFAGLSDWLIVEFVPKSDPKTQMLLASRDDIFDTYTPDNFEAVFGTVYTIKRHESIPDSDRMLYLMHRKGR